MADKYVDIYKELIDKEAQKKAEEMEFLRKHGNAAVANFTATSQGGLAGMPSMSMSQSRGKHHSRSE